MKTLKIAGQNMKKMEVSKSKTNEELTLLGAIEQIVQLSEESNLSDSFYTEAEPFIQYVCGVLDITPIQSILFSILVDNSNKDNIELSDISSHLKCRNVKLLNYLNDLDELAAKKLIRCSHRFKKVTFRISMNVIEALKRNRKYVPQSHADLNITEFFTIIDDLFEQREDEELTTRELLGEIDFLLEQNEKLLFVSNFKSLQIKDENNRLLLMIFCHLFVDNNDDMIGIHDFEDIFDDKLILNSVKIALYSGSNSLICNNLIEYAFQEGFADRQAFKLTDYAKKELLDDLCFKRVATKPSDLTFSIDLTEKSMYYNPREEKEIKQLKSLLMPERFEKIRSRLESSDMRKGFACLFYGTPGTGKTETVYQLAKATRRDIMQVNIAELRSMWVGESEKNVKDIFDRYAKCVQNMEVAPILLFNEADAIFNKRRVGARMAVDKSENTIQNIILEQMEALDGILIATTNLASNMDTAFERRFLYKIKFDKPSVEAKMSIWKTMIPKLKTADVKVLAAKYNFSGGQIENIARKYTVHEILTGKRVALSTIQDFCNTESISNSISERRRIGF